MISGVPMGFASAVVINTARNINVKKPTLLLTIQLGEDGEILTEYAVQALELLTEPETLE